MERIPFHQYRTELFEAYRIYSMRWAIEVCFSEMKGLLKLGKCQCLNFSSQIASISLTVMQYNILSFIKRFEAYETIGGLFNQTINGTMELSVTERIWDLILQIVSAIADLFSADEEEIIRMIANDNQKLLSSKAMSREENVIKLLAKLKFLLLFFRKFSVRHVPGKVPGVLFLYTPEEL